MAVNRSIPLRQLAICTAFALDRVFADPAGWHPVALFGTYAQWLEKKLYRDSKVAGIAYLVLAAGIPTAMTARLACGPKKELDGAAALARQGLFVGVTYFALGGRSLIKTGTKMDAALRKYSHSTSTMEAEKALAQARELVPWLCSRDPSQLDAQGIARATVESLAENTSDATVGTLMWAAVLGAPGVVMHRCVNTLDAMVGYKNAKYSRFGWASARFDDVVNYVPARVTAAIQTVLAGRNARLAWRAWREDAPKHPSPNAGPVEATAAAALGVQLGGRTVYSYGVENRPTLGCGSEPQLADVARAVALSARVQACACAVSVALARVCVKRALR